MTRNLTRSDTISLLSSMGVDIPPTSKLPDKSLRKRLVQALNSAQEITSVVPSSTLYPEQLSPWRGSLYKAVRRGTLEEAVMGQTIPVNHPTDPFHDLRRTITGLAHDWDNGITTSVMQDAEQSAGILMKCVSVVEIDSQTPAIIVLYLPQTRENAAALNPWIDENRRLPGNEDALFTAARVTLLGQALLLTLLEENSRHLSAMYKPKRLQSESNFKLSFILPVGPLDMEGLVKLNKHTGCAVCGKPTRIPCKGCKAVYYCSPACQKADWPTHKATCKTLPDGTWQSIEFKTNIPLPPELSSMLGEGAVAQSLNRLDGIHKLGQSSPIIKLGDSKPFPNVHGERLFLVKFQIMPGEALSPKSMMMYDQQRSFQGHFWRESDEEAFGQFISQMRRPDSAVPGLKMYRYARRVGDWELSVCLDRIPTGNIPW